MSGRYEKLRNTEKVSFVLEKRFRSSGIAFWNKLERLFPNFRLLVGKLNIVRIQRQKIWKQRFTPDITRRDFNKLEGGLFGETKISKKCPSAGKN